MLAEDSAFEKAAENEVTPRAPMVNTTDIFHLETADNRTAERTGGQRRGPPAVSMRMLREQ